MVGEPACTSSRRLWHDDRLRSLADVGHADVDRVGDDVALREQVVLRRLGIEGDMRRVRPEREVVEEQLTVVSVHCTPLTTFGPVR